jgi:hypothetical protein
VGVLLPARVTFPEPRLTFSRSARIGKKDLPPGSNLKQIYDQTYRTSMMQEYFVSHLRSERNITVNGLAALEKIYQRPHGEPWYSMRDVWVAQGTQIYVLSCWTTPNDLDSAQPEFDLIVNSFRFR